MDSYPDEHVCVQLAVVLPVQFAQRADQLPPEYRLMLAVLVDAINTLRHRKLREESLQWIASPDTSWPCTFESICDALGLHADALRTALLNQPNLTIRRARQSANGKVVPHRKRRRAA